MKPDACQTQRDLMVEHALGELEGLKKTRLESHLSHCLACRKAYARVSDGLTCARAWQPEPNTVDVDRMVARLKPLMNDPVPPPRFEWQWGFAPVVFASAAAALLIAFVAGRPGGPEGESKVVTAELVKPVLSPTEAAPEVVAETVSRQTPHRHLRMVSSEDWDGTVEQVGGRTDIAMAHGFAVMDFEGGSGRKLMVLTPDVQVRVLGTRFVVEKKKDATTVAVVSGKVAVIQGGRREVLSAGTVRSFSGTDSFAVPKQDLRSNAFHRDAFLDKPRGSKRSVSARRPDVVTAFTRAEQLVRQGQVDEALEVYHQLIASDDPNLAPFLDMVRYERARVWGFVQKDFRKAAAEMERLARHGQGEVRRQAALARCECDLYQDRCAARACLKNVAKRSELQVEDEVQNLLRVWKLETIECGDHKNGGVEQLHR